MQVLANFTSVQSFQLLFSKENLFLPSVKFPLFFISSQAFSKSDAHLSNLIAFAHEIEQQKITLPILVKDSEEFSISLKQFHLEEKQDKAIANFSFKGLFDTLDLEITIVFDTYQVKFYKNNQQIDVSYWLNEMFKNSYC